MKIWIAQKATYDLIVADPPYNFGMKYEDYNDNLPKEKYIDFTRDWLSHASDLLSEQGSLWVFIPDKWVSYVDLHCQNFGLTRINWIIWHYRFGQCQKNRFINSKTHLLYFAKNPEKRIWNPKSILVVSDRASKYKDWRTTVTETPGLRVPLDVWQFPRIQGNNKERIPQVSNQIPEAILARILLCSTNKTSRVLDLFSGSCGVSCIARFLALESDAVEISETTAKVGWDRILKGPVRMSLVEEGNQQ